MEDLLCLITNDKNTTTIPQVLELLSLCNKYDYSPHFVLICREKKFNKDAFVNQDPTLKIKLELKVYKGKIITNNILNNLIQHSNYDNVMVINEQYVTNISLLEEMIKQSKGENIDIVHIIKSNKEEKLEIVKFIDKIHNIFTKLLSNSRDDHYVTQLGLYKYEATKFMKMFPASSSLIRETNCLTNMNTITIKMKNLKTKRIKSRSIWGYVISILSLLLSITCFILLLQLTLTLDSLLWLLIAFIIFGFLGLVGLNYFSLKEKIGYKVFIKESDLTPIWETKFISLLMNDKNTEIVKNEKDSNLDLIKKAKLQKNTKTAISNKTTKANSSSKSTKTTKSCKSTSVTKADKKETKAKDTTKYNENKDKEMIKKSKKVKN